MSYKKYIINFVMKKCIAPVLILVVFAILSYIFPIIQSIFPVISLPISIYIGIVVVANYSSYESLKSKLFYSCDKDIKDALAKNEFFEVEEFGERLVKIICESALNYGVDDVIFKATEANYIFSNRDKITKNISINDYEKFEEIAKQSAKQNEELKILRNKGENFSFKYKSILLVPMVFNKDYLGYFALCSSHKIFGNLDIWLYSDLENILIDDAFHGLKEKRVKNKIMNLLEKIDEITNQVSLGKLTNLNFFLECLSKIITEELSCTGGYFYLKTGSFIYFPNDLKLDSSIKKNLDEVFKSNLEAQIIDENDPNFSEKLPTSFLVTVPIILEGKYLGNFGVFLNDGNRKDEIKSILDYIEDSVLDNYINMFLERIIRKIE